MCGLRHTSNRQLFLPVFRIRMDLGFFADPDPSFKNPDPDPSVFLKIDTNPSLIFVALILRFKQTNGV